MFQIIILAGISIHKLPINKTFVSTHRAHLNPDGPFAVCSDHFSPDCFKRSLHVDGAVRGLNKGSFPTIWKRPGKPVIGEPLPKQGRRMVSRNAFD